MRENLGKIRSIFKSPGLAATIRWSRCVHLRIVLICLITVAVTLFSLCFTIATKGLVDGAVSSNMNQLRKYAILLGLLILIQHGLSAVRAVVRLRATTDLQKTMQGMLVKELLSKEYPGLKGYHSGELVNRVFSDMNVVKNGVMSILPNFIGVAVSFIGAAAILIAMDWHFVILMLVGGLLDVGYLWPIVREMVKTAIENKQNLIVEGSYVPFEARLDDSYCTIDQLKEDNHQLIAGYQDAGEQVTIITDSFEDSIRRLLE